MEANVEILAHVAAPAMAADDARYRALASAYLAFQPVSQKPLPHVPHPSHRTSRPDPIHHDIDGAECSSQPGVEDDPPAARKDIVLPSLESPELSFSSAWDNAGSPRLQLSTSREQGSQPRASPGLEDSFEGSPSTVPDSFPTDDLRLSDFTSPSRVIEHYLDEYQATQTRTQPSDSGPPPPQLYQDGSQDNFSQGPLEVVIPKTSSATPDVSTISASFSSEAGNMFVPATPPHLLSIQRVNQRDHVQGDDTIIEDTILETSAAREPVSSVGTTRKRGHGLDATPTRAGSEPLPKKQRGSPPSTSPVPPSLPRSSSDSNLGRVMEDAFERGLQYLKHFKPEHLQATELYPPQPPVSDATLTPDDLVTPNLRKLVVDFDTPPSQGDAQDRPSRFSPVETRRELRDFERGYWLLDCSAWEDGLAKLTWCYLGNYVGSKGLAGWGTWCRRDEEWRWIRVYCFGHVVKHIYLLLYAASYRKLKTAGASWIDGAGDVILVTAGHE